MEDTYICVGGVHIQLGWITILHRLPYLVYTFTKCGNFLGAVDRCVLFDVGGFSISIESSNPSTYLLGNSGEIGKGDGRPFTALSLGGALHDFGSFSPISRGESFIGEWEDELHSVLLPLMEVWATDIHR